MNLFTAYKSKAGKPYLKPQIGKFGVKRIVIIDNDGKNHELTNESALFFSTKEITTKTGEKVNIQNVYMMENPKPYNKPETATQETFTQENIPF